MDKKSLNLLSLFLTISTAPVRKSPFCLVIVRKISDFYYTTKLNKQREVVKPLKCRVLVMPV